MMAVSRVGTELTVARVPSGGARHHSSTADTEESWVLVLQAEAALGLRKRRSRRHWTSE